MRLTFEQRIDSCREALTALYHDQSLIEEAITRISTALTNGCRVFACGNGGSAAEAMHFATELSGRYRSNRNPLPCISLTSDATALTCIGNDFGWENIFSRQVEAHAGEGDVLVVFTTSGNSPNILSALRSANRIGVSTIGILGKDGGDALSLCDLPIVVRSNDTGTIQEAHLVMIHIICEQFEPE